MKKLVWIVFTVVFLFYPSFYPSAKNIAYSLHKYSKEEFTHLEESYDENGIKDGILVGGNFQEEGEEEEERTQFILIKYKKNGEKSWTYAHEDEVEAKMLDLDYTYNEEGQVDGYLLIVAKEDEETKEEKTMFFKVSMNGELLSEKETPFPKIKKILPISIDGKAEGYIAITESTEQGSFLIHYNLECDLLWSKVQDQELEDIAILYQEETPTSYMIMTQKESEKSVIRTTIDGENPTTIIPNLQNQDSSLMTVGNMLLIYGLTPDVKVEQEAYSYFLNQYDEEGNLIWESIGEIPINHEHRINLFYKENKFFFCYQNQVDKSYEVITLDQEGLYEKKVKKIPNSYYEIKDFMVVDDVLYFVGKIHCFADDNCDYVENSLFLISDEDKVIELEKKENTNIVLAFLILIFILFLTIMLSRKQRKLK
ncbi:MAG: hypothetical protein IJI60_02200 [Bacilli bacterium]|nr:hypothetical protein [Bacilli bacterium]